MQTNKNHKVYFDIMRIVAALWVIYNHTEAYHAYMHIDGNLRLLYIPLSVITKLSVPLFFMISGATLLKKSESFYVIFRKRILRFLGVLILFCAINFLMVNLDAFMDGDAYSFSPGRFLSHLLSGTIPGCIPYWFLYAYLGFLLCLPFLQHIAKHLSKMDFSVLLATHFVLLSMIPVVNILLNHWGLSPIQLTASFSVPFASSSFLFYPLIGYYLDNHIDIKAIRGTQLFYLFICTLVCVLASCLCIICEGNTAGEYSQNYVALFDYVIAIFAFVGIKYLAVNAYPQFFTQRITAILSTAGSLTFGIYLLDPILVFVIGSKMTAFMKPYLPVLAISFCWCFISMILGGFITFVLKKMPIFRKLL